MPIFSTLISIGLLLLLDQYSKMLASGLGAQTIALVGDILSLRLVANTGIAFSFPVMRELLIVLTLIFSIFIGFLLWRSLHDCPYQSSYWGYVLFFAGAVSNGIDRIFHGYVTDFIALKGFAIFNFADIFISTGAIILIIGSLWQTSPQNKQKQSYDLQKPTGRK